MKAAHVLADVETWCAGAVERVFAAAFPVSIEPVQIARKIVSVFESTALPDGSVISRVTVRLHPRDAARLKADRSLLERQWTEMLARIAVRAGRADSPVVEMEEDPKQPHGTIGAAAAFLSAPPPEERLPVAYALRVRKGVPLDARFPLSRPLVIGREAGCDVVLVDPRVSRRHASVRPIDAGAAFADLDSSNGVFLNGTRVPGGSLREGDVLRLGDTELILVAEEKGA